MAAKFHPKGFSVVALARSQIALAANMVRRLVRRLMLTTGSSFDGISAYENIRIEACHGLCEETSD
jgi:hypothetical protein